MLTLMLALFYPPVPVEPPTTIPKGPAPQIVVAQVDKDGRLVSHRTETRFVPETRTVKSVVNGMVVTRVVTVMIPVMVQSRQQWSLDKATIAEAGGKKLDKATLTQRLAKPAALVVSSDGKTVDPGYLKLFKKDTIVIVVPNEPAEKIPPPLRPKE